MFTPPGRPPKQAAIAGNSSKLRNRHLQLCKSGLASLRSGWRIPKKLTSQFQVALVQGAVFNGVQQRVAHGPLLVAKDRMMTASYIRGLIHLPGRESGQQ